MSHNARDLIAVAVAAGLTGALLTATVVTGREPDTVVQTEPVTPPACLRAIDTFDTLNKATAHLIDTSNQLSPLVARAYAAGLADNDPDRLINQVARINVDLKHAHRDATALPDVLSRQVTRCRTQETPHD